MAESARRPSPSAVGPRRRRWRDRLELAAVAVGLILVVWGADALARLGAESLLERNIQNATGVTARPEVHVRGVFFLPQVIRGAYRHVDVTTQGLSSGPLRVERVESRLTDVRVPFHDVLVQDVRRVGVGRSEEHAILRYDDLNAYFEATGRPFRVAPAADGELRVDGTVDVLGRQVRATADVRLAVQGEILRLEPGPIDTGSTTLGQASRLLLTQRLTLSVPLGTLPFGHQLTGIQPGSDVIELEAEGYGVVLRP